MINFIINHLEIIKNISLFFVPVIVSIGLIIFYSKIYFNYKKIKEVNEKIEKAQIELDNNEITQIGSFEIDLDITGDRKKYKRSQEQNIQRLQRRKNYLLEEISIFKIFKK